MSRCVYSTAYKACDPNPCNNGATCISEGLKFTCECPTFYYGTICDGKPPACLSFCSS